MRTKTPSKEEIPEDDIQTSRKDREARLLERRLFGKNMPLGGTISRAGTVEELSDAYELVFATFLQEGYLPAKSRTRVRVYEALPQMATFVAKLNGQVIGVQSTLPDSLLGLPSDFAFRKEIATLRQKERKVCEATNQAVIEKCRKTPVTTELMRACFAQALATESDDLITAVSESHLGIYEMFGFRLFGSVRSFSSKVDDQVVLMRLDCIARREQALITDIISAGKDVVWNFFCTNNPYIAQIDTWSVNAEKMFSDPEALRELFVVRSGLLQHCSSDELQLIQRIWGDEVFKQVNRKA